LELDFVVIIWKHTDDFFSASQTYSASLSTGVLDFGIKLDLRFDPFGARLTQSAMQQHMQGRPTSLDGI